MVGPHFAGDRLHRLEVAGRGDREAGLDDVHAEVVEGVGDLELLGEVHAGAGRLLAVAQRGVEDQDAIRIVRRHGLTLANVNRDLNQLAASLSTRLDVREPGARRPRRSACASRRAATG